MRKLILLAILTAFTVSCGNESKKKEPIRDAKASANKEDTDFPKAIQNSIKRGKEVYTDMCLQCHLAKGQGVTGIFPPVANSDWLLEKRKESIRTVKYGLKGAIKVNGKEYNNIMLPLGLDNDEVADVMNYIVLSWNDKNAQPYTETEVAYVTK